MGKVSYIKIPTPEELRRNNNHHNKLWLRGGLIALGILLGLNLVLCLISVVTGEEGRLAVRAVATFPVFQIISIFLAIPFEESWGMSFLMLAINAGIYFGIGALIGLIIKRIQNHSSNHSSINHNHTNHNHG